MGDLIDFSGSDGSNVHPFGSGTSISSELNKAFIAPLQFRQPVQSLPEANVEHQPMRVLSENVPHDNSLGDLLSSSMNDDVFNESLFIEANHIASKIADGSILDESCEDGNLLDSTPHPEWNLSDGGETNQICDSETVFKTVDKLIPVINVSQENNNSKNVSSKNISSSSCLSQNDCLLKLSYILKSDNSDPSPSKPRDVKEMLKSLTEIMSNEHRDARQTLEGQNLIFHLARMLHSDVGAPEAGHVDDSGHLSLSTSPINVPPDPSSRKMRGHSINSGASKKGERFKQRSSSFSCPGVPVTSSKLSNNLNSQTEKMKSITLSLSGGGLSGNDRAISKLKPSKADTLRKGPVRAVIPLNSMLRNKENVPPVNDLSHKKPMRKQVSQLYKQKQTGSPVQDVKLKPMAQSTPEDRKNTFTRNLKVMRPRLINKNNADPEGTSALNKSGPSQAEPKAEPKTPLTDDTNKPFNRRRSAGDLKTVGSKIQARRSYSIGKGSRNTSANK